MVAHYPQIGAVDVHLVERDRRHQQSQGYRSHVGGRQLDVVAAYHVLDQMFAYQPAPIAGYLLYPLGGRHQQGAGPASGVDDRVVVRIKHLCGLSAGNRKTGQEGGGGSAGVEGSGVFCGRQDTMKHPAQQIVPQAGDGARNFHSRLTGHFGEVGQGWRLGRGAQHGYPGLEHRLVVQGQDQIPCFRQPADRIVIGKTVRQLGGRPAAGEQGSIGQAGIVSRRPQPLAVPVEPGMEHGRRSHQQRPPHPGGPQIAHRAARGRGDLVKLILCQASGRELQLLAELQRDGVHIARILDGVPDDRGQVGNRAFGPISSQGGHPESGACVQVPFARQGFRVTNRQRNLCGAFLYTPGGVVLRRPAPQARVADLGLQRHPVTVYRDHDVNAPAAPQLRLRLGIQPCSFQQVGQAGVQHFFQRGLGRHPFPSLSIPGGVPRFAAPIV